MLRGVIVSDVIKTTSSEKAVRRIKLSHRCAFEDALRRFYLTFVGMRHVVSCRISHFVMTAGIPAVTGVRIGEFIYLHSPCVCQLRFSDIVAISDLIARSELPN